MHSMCVSVCPCLSETLFAHTFCMWLHCFDILSCPDLRMMTVSSSNWGGSPTSFFDLKYLFLLVLAIYCISEIYSSYEIILTCGLVWFQKCVSNQPLVALINQQEPDLSDAPYIWQHVKSSIQAVRKKKPSCKSSINQGLSARLRLVCSWARSQKGAFTWLAALPITMVSCWPRDR